MQYPRPERCVYNNNNGGDFICWEFPKVLEISNIKSAALSTYNPTINSVCKNMHQTMGDILRTLLLSRGSPIENLTKANDLVDNAL